jgi:hypothetical protein
MCIGYVRASEAAETIPFKCSPCHSTNPWTWESDKEIVSYSYERMSFSFPLSPTNVVRIPHYRYLGNAPTDAIKRADEARSAYLKEMTFSGDAKKAMKIYSSFWKYPAPAYSVHAVEGAVTLSQIMAGQRVNGHQFFDAIRATE